MIQTRRETVLSSVASTTVSRGVGVDNASRVSLHIYATGITSGSAVFTVQVSNDGSNWVDYNRLTSNITNTNAQNDTRIASVLLSTNAGSMLFVPPGDTFNFIRTTVTPNNTVDGRYNAVFFLN